jgi:hypothetical protein
MGLKWGGLALAVVVLALAGCGKRERWEGEGEKPRTEEPASHETVLQNSIDLLNRAADILGTVHDRDSARAADPKLWAVAKQFQQTVKLSQTLGKASAQTETRLAKRYTGPLIKAVQRWRKELARVKDIPGAESALQRSFPEFEKIAEIPKKPAR